MNGDPQKMFIEANPQYKTINFYDGQMKRLGQKQRLDILEKQAVKDFKEEQGMKEDKQQEVKQDNKKSKAQKTGDDLDQPKKKELP